MIGAGFGKGEFAPGHGGIVDLLGRRAALGVWRCHDIAVHITTGGDGIEENLVHALDELFDIALEHAVELEGLAGGQAERRRGDIPRELIENEPLGGRCLAAGQAHAEHEGEGFFLSGLFEGHAQVTVVLEIKPVEFRELTGLFGDGPRGGIGEFLGDRAAQVVRCGFEDFVCAEWLWFLCVGAHEKKGQ